MGYHFPRYIGGQIDKDKLDKELSHADPTYTGKKILKKKQNCVSKHRSLNQGLRCIGVRLPPTIWQCESRSGRPILATCLAHVRIKLISRTITVQRLSNVSDPTKRAADLLYDSAHRDAIFSADQSLAATFNMMTAPILTHFKSRPVRALSFGGYPRQLNKKL